MGTLFSLTLLCHVQAAPVPTFEEVVAAVRENERLYRNYEVRVRKEFTSGKRSAYWDQDGSVQKDKRKPSGDGEFTPVLQKREIIHVVVVKDKVSLKQESWDLAGKRPDEHRTVQYVFDGQMGRLVSGERAEQSQGPMEMRLYAPHMWLVFSSDIMLGSMADWLEHWNRHDGAGMRTVKVLGFEDYNGEPCIKLEIMRVEDTPSKNSAGDEVPFHLTAHLWLAYEKNYLPKARVYWSSYHSIRHPLTVTEIEAYAEIEPGLWYPQRVVERGWGVHPADPELPEPPSRTVSVVEEFKLNPEVSEDLFELEFPKGVPVTELRDGEVIRTHEPDQAATAGFWARWWRVLVIVAGVVLIAGGVLLWVRSRRNGSQAGSSDHGE